MTAALRFETGAATDVGRVRRRNEDAFLASPEKGLWAVADGMGGHKDGGWASATVIAALERIEPASTPSELLARCEAGVSAANYEVAAHARRRGKTVGSTVAVLLICGEHFACIWSGDSRIYLVRDGRIAQLSRDHTEAQELVQRGVLTGEEARLWPGRNVITRAIGIGPEPELDIENGDLRRGDIFVLCSDGLTGEVPDSDILMVVTSERPQAACDALVALALDRGGRDNVTVVVVRYDGELTVLRPTASGLR